MVKKVNVFIVTCYIFFFAAAQLFAESTSLNNVETLILKDEYQQAIRECEMILSKYRSTAIKSRAYYLLGISLLKEGKYEQARENFNIILRQYPHSKFCDDAELGVASSFFLAGDLSQATRKYEEFLRDFPNSELASIARMYLEQSRGGKHFADSYFSVQLGCFASKRNAEKLRDELIEKGFQAYMLELPTDDLCRVRVGKFSNRLEAEFLEQQLRAQGYPTKVCP